MSATLDTAAPYAPPDGIQPFLRTIAERPDEDGPRLVFADYLEERGDPWGEFIRLSFAIRDFPEHGFADCVAPHRCDECLKFHQLKTRHDELLARHGAAWARVVLNGVWPGKEFHSCESKQGWIGFVRHGVTFHWHGGLPTDFTLPLDAWMGGIGPKLLAAAPVRAEGLRFAGKEPNDYGPPEDGWQFGWLNEGETSHFGNARLPSELLQLVRAFSSNVLARWFTAAAAHDALARAAIRWAGGNGVQR